MHAKLFTEYTNYSLHSVAQLLRCCTIEEHVQVNSVSSVKLLFVLNSLTAVGRNNLQYFDSIY